MELWFAVLKMAVIKADNFNGSFVRKTDIDRIIAAVTSLGGKVEDIARTCVYITDEADVEAIARAPVRVFGKIKPANLSMSHVPG